DFEDAAGNVYDRFTDMGATMDDLKYILYRRCDEEWNSATLAVLRAQIAQYHPTYCVVDGVTNAMTLEGLDPLGNRDVAQCYGHIPNMLRQTGGATFMVDHIVKARDGRVPGALGAQHKRAGIAGTTLALRTTGPAGRHRVGSG